MTKFRYTIWRNFALHNFTEFRITQFDGISHHTIWRYFQELFAENLLVDHLSNVQLFVPISITLKKKSIPFRFVYFTKFIIPKKIFVFQFSSGHFPGKFQVIIGPFTDSMDMLPLFRSTIWWTWSPTFNRRFKPSWRFPFQESFVIPKKKIVFRKTNFTKFNLFYGFRFLPPTISKHLMCWTDHFRSDLPLL